MQLTLNVTSEQLTSSGNHPGIENPLPAGWDDRLLRLAQKLEAAQTILAVPLRISYGYRCPALNQACGGSTTSDHMYARAVDFNPIGMSRVNAFLKLWAHPTFMQDVDQLIFERGCLHLGMGLRKRRQGRGDMPLYPLLAVWPAPLTQLTPEVKRA